MFKHVVLGLDPPKLNDPQIKSTLSGVKNKYGSTSKGKDPMFLFHLRAMAPYVDTHDHISLLTYIAAMLMFRCLLRVGQVVSSPHTLLRSSLQFTDYGMLVIIRSSKTTSGSDPPTQVPVARLKDKKMCIVTLLGRFLEKYPMPSSAPLFSTSRVPGLSYSAFSKKFRELIKLAGLVGNFASHSLRRGGATSMSEMGLSVPAIKKRGRWRSNCVNKYIVHSLTHDVKQDTRWASKLY